MLSGLVVRKIKKVEKLLSFEMNRKARDFESRRQIEDLNRYRKQNADLMREADHTIQATSKYKLTDFNPQQKKSEKLEASMSQIGQIICRDKKDAKTAKIQECLKVPRVWIIISDFLN